jgi:xanthine/uracil permease
MKLFKNSSNADINNIYTLNGRVPFLKSIPFGLQHVLAMFVANIAPIMIVAGTCGLSPQDTASLIQTAMIMAGIGTMIQLFTVWKIGARLPIVMGISFTFVSVFGYVGTNWGYGAIIGGVGQYVIQLIFVEIPSVAATIILINVGIAQFKLNAIYEAAKNVEGEEETATEQTYQPDFGNMTTEDTNSVSDTVSVNNDSGFSLM